MPGALRTDNGTDWAAADQNLSVLGTRPLPIARAAAGQHRRLPNAGYAPGFST